MTVLTSRTLVTCVGVGGAKLDSYVSRLTNVVLEIVTILALNTLQSTQQEGVLHVVLDTVLYIDNWVTYTLLVST